MYNLSLKEFKELQLMSFQMLYNNTSSKDYNVYWYTQTKALQ